MPVLILLRAALDAHNKLLALLTRCMDGWQKDHALLWLVAMKTQERPSFAIAHASALLVSYEKEASGRKNITGLTELPE